jgi:glycosyltransferase involved in cell wall biosynthesis
MLVCGRPEMTARAVRSYEAQSYQNKELIFFENLGLETIGALRNKANALATGEIICHFDTDDTSHPNRISEQVALLTASDADAVGYSEMLFWRTPQAEAWLYAHRRPGHALGTSLCYWRETWECKAFADAPKGECATGEDHLWRLGLNVVSVGCFERIVGYTTEYSDTRNPQYRIVAQIAQIANPARIGEPRMIASIHGGNSSNAYNIEAIIARGGTEWMRTPSCDSYCREKMKL